MARFCLHLSGQRTTRYILCLSICAIPLANWVAPSFGQANLVLAQQTIDQGTAFDAADISRYKKRAREDDEKRARKELEEQRQEEASRDTHSRDSNDTSKDRDHPNDTGLDGGQFKRPDFIDTDFHKPSFRDDTFRTKLPDYDETTRVRLFSDALDRISKIPRVTSVKGDDISSQAPTASLAGKDDWRTWTQLLKPTPLGDWVPASVDPEDNGGFGVDDGNGRPVPYRLNGHVGIERGYPWDPSN